MSDLQENRGPDSGSPQPQSHQSTIRSVMLWILVIAVGAAVARNDLIFGLIVLFNMILALFTFRRRGGNRARNERRDPAKDRSLHLVSGCGTILLVLVSSFIAFYASCNANMSWQTPGTGGFYVRETTSLWYGILAAISAGFWVNKLMTFEND